MSKLVLYQDEEKEIYLSKEFIDFIDKYYIKKFKLDKASFDLLISGVLRDANSKKLDLKDIQVYANSNVLYLKYGQKLVLLDRFKIFEEAFDLLTEIEDYDIINMEEIKRMIESEGNIYCNFYPEKFFGVGGYLFNINENKEMLITFFSY